MQIMHPKKRAAFRMMAAIGREARHCGEFVLWIIGHIVAYTIFVASLVLMSIALLFYCLIIRKLPTQLQEQELLDEYQKGVDFGRRDTLEKLTTLGHAFKATPDGAVSIIPEVAALGSMPNKTLAG